MIRRTKIKFQLPGKSHLIFNSASSLVIVAICMESREILKRYECEWNTAAVKGYLKYI